MMHLRICRVDKPRTPPPSSDSKQSPVSSTTLERQPTARTPGTDCAMTSVNAQSHEKRLNEQMDEVAARRKSD